uniref:peptidyl-tRNA hydrolase n=1 Tax=Pithovirus LCPAC304 TaxID=2506594 RepID=A0A481Z7I8_9VIRU|nr:MAG: peptidyl-tRNA hydrolase [Pithovirus LCPAC304]
MEDLALEKLSKESKENEYVMYIVVNHDLKMGKGKIAAQVAHSACRVIRFLESLSTKPFYYRQWISNYEPKIVLKATKEQMKDIMKIFGRARPLRPTHTDFEGIWCFHTIDAGRTQIAPGSLTTLAFRPFQRKEAPEILRSLKLL